MINDAGKNNVITGAEGLDSKLNITINGSGNEIVFGKNFRCSRVSIRIKSNRSKIVFGDDCKLIGTLAITCNSPHNTVTIGDRFQVTGSIWMAVADRGRSISIGDDVLVASARIRTSDHHRIYDLDGTVPINPAADVRIGNHVWMGDEVLVLKGADIGSGCVVGARSLVSKPVPENVLVAGNPLRVIREKIRWEI